jgi:hypothetical protein
MPDRVVHCDLCGKQLEPVFPGRARRREDNQFLDCLHIVIGGGYGEYLDGNLELTVCQECADKFRERNPQYSLLMDKAEPDFGIF